MNFLQSFRKAFRFIAVITLIFCLFNPVSSYAQEGQAIGRVLSTTGSVTARDLSGTLRQLSRRSDIFVGDTVITGPNGFAQLRMVDSAQISFKEDTEFTFSEYSSDGPGGAADSALMEMVRGGFRTISGTIGDDAADDYQVTTQFASIGIRGTTHEAVIDAGSLLTGVYDGGTTISNAQGSLDTGEGANFDYTQTFPGQAPQGLLQQPAQLGRINLNAAAAGANDGDDDGDDDGDGDGNDGANDGDGDGNADNNDGDDNGGIADSNDENPGTRPLGNQQGNNPTTGLANVGDGNTNVDPNLDTTRTTEVNINPVINVRTPNEFEGTGTGRVVRVPDPAPPAPDFIQPSTDFLALVANSGFNTDFSLSELQGVTGRFSEVLAFNGIADIGGLSAAAVGDGGQTTTITALTMSFDLNFSASLAQVSNGFLGISLDDAPTPIAFNIYFSGDIINSQSDFTIGSSSNRTQGNQTSSINLQTSFLDSILVDDGVEQALFSDFFFEDTQGLGVEGQALVGFATPVLSPADISRAQPRLGFTLSRNSSPGAIFPGNTSSAVSGSPFLLIGNDLSTPRTVDTSPNFIFKNNGSFFEYIDGNNIAATNTLTNDEDIDYDFQVGLWGSSSDPVRLYTDFEDNSVVQLIDTPMLFATVNPTPLADLSGSVFYANTAERVLGGSSLGNGINSFFTSFNVNFTTALVTDGYMTFCAGNGFFCSDEGTQRWELDYSGTIRQGYVVATPVANSGSINDVSNNITGLIEGVFTGTSGAAFIGGFNLVSAATGQQTAETADGVFLIEQEHRVTSDELLSLERNSFLVQERYARIFYGNSRPTSITVSAAVSSVSGSTYDNPIIFRDLRARPRIILRDDDFSVSVSDVNSSLGDAQAAGFDVAWERWDGPLTTLTDNFDASVSSTGNLYDLA